ncbi:MAG: ribonuclease R [Clostridiales bacterium]|nr:ribonuclease R [Clostridiales bacterium]
MRQHILNLVNHPQYHPMKVKELAILLQIPKEERERLQFVLDQMVAAGDIGCSRRGKYGEAQEQILTGIFQASAKGFGFVSVEGEEEDFYIPEHACGGAMHGDLVKMTVCVPGGGDRRAEGRIIEIEERNTTDVVGLFQSRGTFGFVVPDNTKLYQDIFIPESAAAGAVNGHIVVAHLENYGDENHSPEGRITEILGHRSDPGVDITAVVRAFGIPDEFPEEVMNQAASVPLQVTDYEGRMDLRDWQTVTIDGEDAKDLDDAVTLERTDSGYRLGVHIADVSEYVTEDSPLDEEAKRRGTSTYLADRVIPMLPHRLSNGICSLNQGEDRLALSCLMDIDLQGNIVSHQISETIIRVDKRMSYHGVQAVLDGDEEACKEYDGFEEMIFFMKELADKLRAKRRKRGSLDFDLPESKIVLDEKGYPIDIYPYERSQATNIIEDFMLAANETVAEDYYWQELPFVYRTHEKPDPEKILELSALLRSLGVKLRSHGGEIHPRELQKMLAEIEDSPEEAFVSRLALRSMKQARYSTECTGHFGLAATYYCHFTSPIRRYPDLQIHRIIKENLRGRLDEGRINHYYNILQEVCRNSSKTERRAEEAERQVNKHKMAQYMQKRRGNSYEGIISGVVKWGIYVELPNTVEGLVHVRNMNDDHYTYDEKKHELVGERKKKIYRLGQQVRVLVEQVDLGANTIDFLLAKEPEE